MIELAITIAAFLFLCWVAIAGLAIVWAVIQKLVEEKVIGMFVLAAALPLAL